MLLCNVNTQLNTPHRAQLKVHRSCARAMFFLSVRVDETERVRGSSTLLCGIIVPFHDSGEGSNGHTG